MIRIFFNRFDEIEREEMMLIDSVPLDLDIPDDTKVIRIEVQKHRWLLRPNYPSNFYQWLHNYDCSNMASLVDQKED